MAALSVVALPLVGIAPPAQAAGTATASITGTVFRDYNSDGIDNTAATVADPAVDVGIAGGTVTAYDAAGTQVGTTTSGTAGTYTLSVTGAASQQLRLEFAPPPNFLTGPIGPAPTSAGQITSGGPEQFVTPSTVGSTYNFGVEAPGDYCQSVPNIVVSCLSGALAVPASGNGGSNYTVSSTPALYSVPYTASGDISETLGTGGTNAKDIKATLGQLGSTWGNAVYNYGGVAYDFNSAFFRRDAALGPGGLGAIYATNLGATTPNASLMTTIGGVGTDPRVSTVPGQPNVETIPATDNYDWFHDTAAFPQEDKIGLGTMALSDDQSTLYVVNLAAKSLEVIPITAPTSTTALPTAGAAASYPLPTSLPGATQGCPTADVQSFAVATQPGQVYVGLTCVGPVAADLQGYVYTFDPTTHAFGTAPVTEFGLGWNRGCVYLGACTTNDANFQAWNNNFPNSSGAAHDPQPLLSAMAFDSNGDMTVAVRDRFADDGGQFTGNPLSSTDTGTYGTFAAGEVLRACLVGGKYQLESNGTCGTRTGAAGNGPGNNAGPGGGQFYYQQYPSYHQHTATGGLAQAGGFATLVVSHYDSYVGTGANNSGQNGGGVNTGGFAEQLNVNGATANNNQAAADLYDTNNQKQTFAKASGLGDVALDCGSAPIEIGHRVWIDTNGNGIQDPGEPVAAGVTVTLESASGSVLATTKTDANGVYTFSSTTVPAIVANAAYTVLIGTPADFATGGALAGDYPTTTTAGTDPLADSNGAPTVTNREYASASVTTGQPGDDSTLDIDFGFSPLYGVGDFVWADTNDNGIQDGGEPGINGASVTLFAANGTTRAVSPVTGQVVASVTTGTSPTGTAGYYELGCVPPGSYTVKFTLPNGGTFTQQVASPAATNSDAVPGTGFTAPFVLGPTDTNVSPVTSADAQQCSAGIDRTIDAGVAAATVTGEEYFDANANGVLDPGETGVSGLTVSLTTSTGGAVTSLTGTTVASTTTGTGGTYSFTDLPAGSYKVVFSDGTGESFTTPTSGTSPSFALPTGGTQVENAGVTAPGSVSGVVFGDTNRDGVQQTGEAGVGGVTVTLKDSAGTVVATTTSATTASGPNPIGSYSFPTVAPGTGYTVSFSLPAGDSYTSPSTGISAPLTVTASRTTTQNQGVVAITTYGVGDFVWFDANADGLQQSGEPGINGVTVELLTAGGAQATTPTGALVPVTTTADNPTTGAPGYYALGCVAAGQYQVRFTLPGGGTFTTEGSGADRTVDSNPAASGLTPVFTLGPTDPQLVAGQNTTCSGGVDPTIDAGVVGGTLSGTEYTDVNRDGIYEPGTDTPVAGVTVTLADAGGGTPTNVFGAPVGPTTTSGTGAYSFADLPPGNYTVTFTDPSGDVFVAPASGTSPATAVTADHTATVNGGVTPSPNTVAGTEYLDTNRDGVVDAGDTPVSSSITVTLTDSAGNPVAGTNGQTIAPITTTNGSYSFADVPPGAGYQVTFTSPTGDVFVGSTGSGTTSGINVPVSGAVTVNSLVTPIPGALDGVVFDDTNGDGVQQSGEAGVAGVTVTLTTAGGQPVVGTDGRTIAPITTAAAGSGSAVGSYAFANVPTGSGYVVSFSLPPGDRYTVASSGSDAGLAVRSGATTVQNQGVTPLTYGVGNFVWDDVNANGVQDPGEAGINGVSVSLLSSTGAVLSSTVTAASPVSGAAGYYFLGCEPAGSYEVRFTLPGGGVFTSEAAGGDRTVDSNPSPSTGLTPVFALGGSDPQLVVDPTGACTGGVDPTIDAGEVSGSLSGVEYTDVNRDGAYESGTDTPVSGQSVSLETAGGGAVTDVFGSAVGSVVTGSDGSYDFAGLVPGAYRVVFSAPSGTSYVAPATGVSPSTVVPAGGVGTADAGVTASPGTISGEEYVDANDNGAFDTGESAVSGSITVTLSSGGQPVVGTDGVQIAPVTTTTGAYAFTQVPPGTNYTVTFTDPSGYVFTNPVGGTSRARAVTSGGTTTQNAGVILPTYGVGNFVWDDANANGVQDSGEAGINGVAVSLLSSTGAVVSSTVTAASPVSGAPGYYFLGCEPAGSYQVQFTLGAGGVYTSEAAGGDRTVDSNPSPTTGLTPVFALGASDAQLVADPTGACTGGVDPTIDAGEVSGSLSGVEYTDVNRDGVYQSGSDTPVSGQSVSLETAAGGAVTDVFGKAVGSVVTGSDGSYDFTGLIPGTYKVVFSAPSGTTYVAPATGVSPSTVVPAGGVGTANAGVTASPGTISGEEYVDANDNGALDPGESPVSGSITVTLSSGGQPVVGTDGVQIAPVTTTNGSYAFTKVPPGTNYTVTFTDPSGYVFTNPATGAATVAVTTAATTTQNAGVFAAANAVNGTEYLDANRNGTLDPGEQPVTSPVTVTLSLDGQPVTSTKGTPIDPITTTDGSYSFTDVPAGTGYVVTFTLPSGDVFTAPAGGTATVTVPPNGTVTANAGITPVPGSISGVAYDDASGDGVYDPGETGVAGVTVTLTDAGGHPVIGDDGIAIAPVTTASTATGGNPVGYYDFPSVPPGTGYLLAFSLPTGDRYTTPEGGQAATAVTTGQASTVNAGVISPTYGVGDFVWDDVNGNGVQDPGEAGINGVAVSLLGSTGAVVSSTVTAASPVSGAAGYYFLGCMPAGSYQVRFTAPDGDVFTKSLAGTDVTVDSDAGADGTTAAFALGATDAQLVTAGSSCSGGTDPTIDAGVVAPETVSGSVTVQTAGTAVSGVDVTLLDASTGQTAKGAGGVAIPVVMTGTGGSYSFSGVLPGSYEVSFGALPGGDTYVTPSTGTTATTPAFPVTSGTPVTEVDATVTLPPATYGVGDFVWDDVNGNGVQDPGEAGINGVAVSLLGSTGAVVSSTVTADAPGTSMPGYYFLGCVPAGSYEVRFTAPDGDVFTKSLAGTDVTVDSDAGADGTTAVFALGATDAQLVTAGSSCSGGTDPTIDAGVVAPETVSGSVTVQTAGTAVSGVDVTLLDASTGQTAKGAGGVAIPVVMTGTGGSYSFSGVLPGSYEVSFGALPGGDTYVTPSTGTTATTPAFPVTSGTPVTGETATVIPPPAKTYGIGDFAWNDLNGDGLQDNGEAGVDGVTVTLLDANGHAVTSVAPALTGTDGSYFFGCLPAGTYQVSFSLPTGYGYTRQMEGADTVDDSNVDPATGRATVTLGSADPNLSAAVPGDPEQCGGGVDRTIDAGYIQPGSVTGVLTAGSATGPGISGVGVTLIDATTGEPATQTDGTAIPATATGPGGTYSFASVPPGTYRVDFGSLPAGDAYASPTGGDTATFPLLGAGTAIESGVVTEGYGVGDFVWLDTNHNGIQDSGEPGLDGVTVQLFAADGTTPATTVAGQAVPPTTTTTGPGGTTGYYELGCVPAGNYVVHFTLPGGYQWTTPTATGSTAANDSNAAVTATTTTAVGDAPVTLGSGDADNDATATACGGGVDPTVDAGLYQEPATITGTVLLPGGAPLPAGSVVTVTVIDPTTGKPVDEPAEPGVALSATVGADGSYSIPGVPPGTYQVLFGGVPSGYTLTDPQSGTSAQFTLAPAGTEPEDATVTPDAPGTGIVSGTLSVAGDPALRIGGVTVTLLTSTGATVTGVTPATTDANGSYSFTGVPIGQTYEVVFGTLPAGDTYVTPATGTEAVPTVTSGGDSVADATVSEAKGTITGKVTSSSGAPEAGATVTLLDGTGRPVAGVPPVTTTASGTYSFTVPPGTYEIGFTAPTGDGLVTPASGQTAPFTVAPSGTATQNAVVAPAIGSITGTVTDEAGSPVPGVVVTLLAADGKPLAGTDGKPITTTTGPTGSYTFAGLTPGTYEVGFGTLPAGDTYAHGDTSAPVAVTAGASSHANAVVTVPTGTVTGTVTTPTGAPVGGTTVTVLGPTGKPATGPTGAPIPPVVTNPGGGYSIPDVPAGQYTIVFTPPSGDTVKVPAGGRSPLTSVTSGTATVVDATVATPVPVSTVSVVLTAPPVSSTVTPIPTATPTVTPTTALPHSVAAGLGPIDHPAWYATRDRLLGALLALLALALAVAAGPVGVRRRRPGDDDVHP